MTAGGGRWPVADGGGIDPYRKITGNVWEDIASASNTVDLSGLTEYLGNGKKDSSESGAKDILVKLYEVKSDSSENDYLVDTGIYTMTASDGSYTLGAKDTDKNLLYAGTYVVRFIYGSQLNGLSTDNNGDTISFSGQDYKSTTYTSVGETSEDGVVEADAFETASAGKGTLSFAKDNELRRLEVIEYSTTMTYELDSTLKNASSTDLASNTEMFADTSKFNVQIEYKSNYADFDNRLYTALKDDETGFNQQTHIISEINFGLIERPKTILELADDITEVIATTSDGNELVHLYYDVTYSINDSSHLVHNSNLNSSKSTGAGNVQSLNRSGTSQGFRYVNVDTDILQGLTITVKYQVAVANVSETDSSGSNLVAMVKNDEISTVVSALKNSINSISSEVYKYNGGESGTSASSSVAKDYSYNKLTKSNAVNNVNSTYTYSGVSYYSGYFVGNTYYTGTKTKTVGSTTITDVAVETRVDKIVDYIDTDAEYIASDNVNDSGYNKFVTYSLSEIASNGVTLNGTATTLLSGITLSSVSGVTEVSGLNNILTDGTTSIISYSGANTIVKNNAIFNVESSDVNGTLYKYLTPTNKATNNLSVDKLYSINLQCSRTLTSESDADGISIENIAEIVKVSNTVGRKVYVTGSTTTGHIGNSSETITKLTGTESIGTISVAAESDTDYTEQVTLSPPTGLTASDVTEQRVVNVVIVIVAVAAVAAVVVATIMTVKLRKKFYK